MVYDLEKFYNILTKKYNIKFKGIRENNLLQSLNDSINNLDESYYITIKDRARFILKSLLKNHIFLDGNKRMALLMFIVFLYDNNYIETNLSLDNIAPIIEKLGESFEEDNFLKLYDKFELDIEENKFDGIKTEKDKCETIFHKYNTVFLALV